MKMFNLFEAFLKLIAVSLSIVLLWRVVVFELVWLIPRQPITGLFITIVFHRIACLHIPNEFYHVFSPLFDGDATPTVLVLFMVTLATIKAYLPTKSIPVYFKFVLVFSILSWLSRIIDAEINHRDIASELEWLEKHKGETDRWFSIHNHILNSHFVPDVILPEQTVVYKTISVQEATRNDCELGWLPIPGDDPDSFDSSWSRFEKTGNLELDIFMPRNTSNPKPKVILYLHGGGWEKGHRHFLSQNYHGGVPHYLIQQNIIVSVSYRMSCMNLKGPDILQDVYDAAFYLYQNSVDLFGQKGSELEIIPWGTSAGGTLALLLAYKYAHELPISAVINFYGVTEFREEELAKLTTNPYEKVHNDVFVSLSRHVCETKSTDGGEVVQDKSCFTEFSPVAHVTSNSVPTLTVHGKQDGLVLVSQAMKLQEVLQEHNVTEATVMIQGVHDCDVLTSSFCSQVAISTIDAFLRHLDDTT